MIGIIGAMESEVRLLLAQIQDRREIKTGGFTFYTGMLAGQEAAVVQCGIGKCAAAACAQQLIDRFEVQALVNTGVAGGLAEGLSVGDLVIGAEAVQHDFDVHLLGYAKGYMCTGGDPQEPTVYRADPELCALARRAAVRRMGEEHVFSGRIATGDCFVAALETKLALRREFGAAAAEMEGAAIAQVAQLNGVRFLILRVISDLAQENAPESFEGFEERTAHLSSLLVLDMLHALSGQ